MEDDIQLEVTKKNKVNGKNTTVEPVERDFSTKALAAAKTAGKEVGYHLYWGGVIAGGAFIAGAAAMAGARVALRLLPAGEKIAAALPAPTDPTP